MNLKPGLPAVASERGGGSKLSIRSISELMNGNIVAEVHLSSVTTKANLSHHVNWLHNRAASISLRQTQRHQTAGLYILVDNINYIGHKLEYKFCLFVFLAKLEQFNSTPSIRAKIKNI